MDFHSNPTISTEDRERYLECLAVSDLSIQKKNELIDTVHQIISHFVDQAFNVQTDQITLQSRAKAAEAAEGAVSRADRRED